MKQITNRIKWFSGNGRLCVPIMVLFTVMGGQTRDVPVQLGDCHYTTEPQQMKVRQCSHKNGWYCISKGFCNMYDQSKVYFPTIMCYTMDSKCPSATDCAFGHGSAFLMSEDFDLQQPYKVVSGRQIEVDLKTFVPPARVFKENPNIPQN